MLDNRSRWTVDGVDEAGSHAAATICQWAGPHSTLEEWLAELRASGLTVERTVEWISGACCPDPDRGPATDDHHWTSVLVYAYRHAA